MATSNPLPVTVVAPAPLEHVGWEVKVVDYRDYSTVLAVIGEFMALSVGVQLSDPGSGSITLDLDLPIWQTTLPNGQPAETLRDHEYLWQCFDDGILQFEFLGQSVEEHFVDDDESRAVTISGPGAAATLRYAKIMPPGFPKPVPTSMYETSRFHIEPDGSIVLDDPTAPSLSVVSDPTKSVGYTNEAAKLGWEFPLHWSAMKIWWTMFRAAQSRKLLTWVTPIHFNDEHDSGGLSWEYIPTVPTVSGAKGFRPVQGTNLLDFLNECTGQDYSQYFAMRAEWIMRPGMKLEVRKAIGLNLVNVQGIGTDRSKQVQFFDGLTGAKQRIRARDEIVNYVASVDQNGHFSVAADATSIGQWHKRELWDADNLNITDHTRQAKIAAIRLEQRKDEKAEWTITLPATLPGRRPLRDFGIGDWITIHTFNSRTLTSVPEKFRVLAITIGVEGDAETAELTLQSLFDYQAHLLENRLTQLINKIGGPGPIPPQPAIPPLDGYNTGDFGTGDFGTGDFNTGGDGSRLGGVHVFIQDTDPGSKARTGDFWFDTGSPGVDPFDLSDFDPDPADTSGWYLGDSARANLVPIKGRIRFE